MLQELLGAVQAAKVLGEQFGVTPDLIALAVAVFFVAVLSYKVTVGTCKVTAKVYRTLKPKDELVDKIVTGIQSPTAFWIDTTSEIVSGSLKVFLRKNPLDEVTVRDIMVGSMVQPLSVLSPRQTDKINAAAQKYYDWHIAKVRAKKKSEFLDAVRYI